jgi:ADP-heptose:LPS heptosyltransferase
LRANALGDFIFILPALEALKACYPEAEIVLLGKEWHAQFLSGRPGPACRVVVVPPCRGVGMEPGGEEDPEKLEQFFTAMAGEHFDLALQLHGGGRYSNPFTKRLGARVTAGLKTPDAVPLDRWLPYVYYQPEVWRYLEVAGLVGASPVVLEPHLTVTERDLAESLQVVEETECPLALLHPGATDPRRRWPAAKFAAVGDALAAHGTRVVVTGTAPEASLVADVVAAMHQEAENLCGCLSLGGLAGLLARCQVVVSNDSGPLHLAAAVGAATVGIYWCGNALMAAPPTRSRHRPLISWRLRCPVCGLDCTQGSCDHDASFVADVPVEEACGAVLTLLEATQPS